MDPRTYRIFGGDTIADLEATVNKYIKVGYEPCGSIFSFTDSRCVYQPMLKRHPNPTLEPTRDFGAKTKY